LACVPDAVPAFVSHVSVDWVSAGVLLLMFAVFSVVERRGMANTQKRDGPVSTGAAGAVLPLSDAGKLLQKSLVVSDSLSS
jgi:NADH:ubiquinone oxidoreductase subunit H